MVSSQPHILVIDDNVLLHGVFKGVAKQEQWAVSVASSGEEGLEVLRRSPVDIVLCDIMMPGMDGYQFYHKLRTQVDKAHIPCVFLSALASAPEITKGVELGVDDYITKPFAIEDLVRIVRGKLKRADQLKRGLLEHQSSYRKKIIQTLSHELRTPLVSITTGTELLLDQKEKVADPRVVRVLEAIWRGGMRLEKLVNDFFVLQQIEAGVAAAIVRDRAEVRKFEPMILEWFESQRVALAERGFTLHVASTLKTEIVPPQVKVYEPYVLDALSRIISNAEKFSQNRKEIAVLLAEVPQGVSVEIKDRGIGIDPARAAEALDLFGQLDREKLEQQGGGLGLPIASRYLGLHGGSLALAAREGGGTVATVLFPRV